MKKKVLSVLAFTLVLSLVLTVVVVAGDCGPPPCEPPPPPPTCQGCTPGYWKQEHHFDSWVGYSPGDNFNAVFGCGPDDMTLLEALKARGPGSELLRHGVAGLLNAASPDVAYGGSVGQVIEAVCTGNAHVLVINNELVCPLN